MAEWVYSGALSSFVSNFVLFPLFYPEGKSWTEKHDKEEQERAAAETFQNLRQKVYKD